MSLCPLRTFSTIVPYAVGAGVGAIESGIEVVVMGIVHRVAMLNLQRWVGSAQSSGVFHLLIFIIIHVL